MAEKSISRKGSFFETAPEAPRGSCEWDKKTHWLGVRFNKNDTSYVFRCQKAGKVWWVKLGPTSSLTVEQARDLTLQMAVLVKDGRDPRVLIENLRPFVSVTLKQLVSEYLDISYEHKKSYKQDKSRIQYLEPLLERTISSITTKEVADLQKNIKMDIRNRKEAKGYAVDDLTGNRTANLVIEQLRNMFNTAIDWGYLSHLHRNPAQGFRRYPTFPSAEFITLEQMPKLLEVLNEYPDHQAANVIKLALLTGMRANELTKLTWKEINLASGTITITGRRTKNGKPLIQPITKDLADLLNSIHRTDSDWVFPGRFKGTRRHHVDDEWRNIRELAGIPNVRFHDLRRTAGSWLVDQTGSLALVGQVLNQTNQHVTKTYSLYDTNQMRDALQGYHEKLRALGLESAKGGKEDE